MGSEQNTIAARLEQEGGKVHASDTDQSDVTYRDFQIRMVSTAGRSIVYVSGEVDAYSAARLRDSLAGLINAGSRHIVVDLADVSFMAASGLGVLVAAGKRLRRHDGKLLLRSAPPSVQKMIEITGLDATLPCTNKMIGDGELRLPLDRGLHAAPDRVTTLAADPSSGCSLGSVGPD